MAIILFPRNGQKCLRIYSICVDGPERGHILEKFAPRQVRWGGGEGVNVIIAIIQVSHGR